MILNNKRYKKVHILKKNLLASLPFVV